MLGGAQLAAGHNTFRLSHGAEITTEANPKPTSPELFDGLLVAGYTPGVAGHADRASGARGAGSGAFTRPGGGRRPRGQAAGFDHHNLDLIYGTPEGERHDLTRLVGAAIGPGTGDISACALVVEDGNRAGPPRSRAHKTWWWNVTHPNTYAEHVATETRPVPAASGRLMAILYLFQCHFV